MTTNRALAGFCASVLLGMAEAIAQAPPPPPPSLKTVTVPEPPNLYEFVSNKAAAIALGKALFWDMQVGSDGIVACATCHFHAGADSRSMNQLSPGLLRRNAAAAPLPDRTLDFGANVQLTPDHFPLRLLSNAADRTSDAIRDSNDVVASQGVFHATFVDVAPGSAEEIVVRAPDPDGFQVGGINVRRVERRHTPSVINAVFNHRNFWDGRAQNEFNGVNEWGDRDPHARVLRMSKGELIAVPVRLVNASLASQAVAPLVSPFEMAADGRSARDLGNKFFRKKGSKLEKMRPLAGQLVHRNDSVLGSLSRAPQPGLGVSSYEAMIKAAFRSEWWSSNRTVRVAPDGTVTVDQQRNAPGNSSNGRGRPAAASDAYTQLAYNFPLFFGLAVQLYEATLVSDDTPYDRWREGRGQLSKEALLGLEVFLAQEPTIAADGRRRSAGRCVNCHAGPEFTDASVDSVAGKGETRNREEQDLDRGFNNIGLRPWVEDLGVGGWDPFGNPLANTRVEPKSPRYIAVDGAFKAPGLRNVELTAPYFHHGGHATLESVVDLYSRGGDIAPIRGMDGTEIRPLSFPLLSDSEAQGMVAFMKSLTDERVRHRRAPFDHPQLFVPDGQLTNHLGVIEDPLRPGQALDRLREIPAVGREGGAPLPNFLAPPP